MSIIQRAPRRAAILLTWAILLPAAAWGKTVVTWDFTKGTQDWQGNRDVQGLAVTAEGLAFESTGNDPWIEGPAVDLPGQGMTRVNVRMKSQADASGELFYGRTFLAGHSVRFTIRNDGRWHVYALTIAAPLGRGTRFRLDPAVGLGHIVVGSIEVETLPSIPLPAFEPPRRPAQPTGEMLAVQSGAVTLEHCRSGWGDFVIRVDGTEMAAGYGGELIGVLVDDQPQWLSLRKAESACERGAGGELVCRAVLRDPAGGRWQMTRRMWPTSAMSGASRPRSADGTSATRDGPVDALTVETEFSVNRDREVVYLPWLTLFPGLETFGERKTQGLFAGLEYLGDEPSSSEADITTPEHLRRVPDPVKITLPLMALAQGGRYLGLIWEPSEGVAAVFDSPDRIFPSGAHVMALVGSVPGRASEGTPDGVTTNGRFENQLVAHSPFVLRAHQPLRMRATIIGGPGATVVPAVRKYVELRGLPLIPGIEGGFDAAATLLAHGWLDSAINEGGLFRHAVWGDNFRAGPAADAVMYMDWLAQQAPDRVLADRLTRGRDLGLTRLPPGEPYSSAISHTRTPAAPFVFGNVAAYVEQRKAEAQNLLRQFDDRGIKWYRPGKVDYGKTHFARHANGLAAVDVARILEAATLSADPALIEHGLALLDKQTILYANTVPRGAQTWEVPLHTPDILASAHLVQAYTLGFLISGKPEYLEQARYWAWTGVPFVYLLRPTGGAIGPYATIAVLGATNWKAPVWFGRPVQWCGLVYASALHLLSQYDAQGPWETIAKGITATGVQMTWPRDDAQRQGLLPDVFDLTAQLRDGPAINPGTVQAHVPELFGRGMLYSVRKLPRTGWFLHAPCAIHDLRETDDAITFSADGWGGRPFYILLAGVPHKPVAVTIRPVAQTRRPPVSHDDTRLEFEPRGHLLTISLDGSARVQLRRH